MSFDNHISHRASVVLVGIAFIKDSVIISQHSRVVIRALGNGLGINMKSHENSMLPPSEVDPIYKTSKSDALEYMKSMMLELREIALSHRLKSLSYFIEMALIDASDIQRSLPRGGTDKAA